MANPFEKIPFVSFGKALSGVSDNYAKRKQYEAEAARDDSYKRMLLASTISAKNDAIQNRKDEIDLKSKFGDRDFELEKQKLGLEAKKIQAQKDENAMTMKGMLSPGQLKADQDYGSKYGDYVKNAPVVRNDLAKLKETLNKLGNNDELTGTFAKTFLPEDAIKYFDKDAVATAQDIKSVLFKSLKTTFGGQLSDGERKAMVETAWDYALPVEDNVAKVQAMIANMEDSLAEQDAMARTYEKERSIKNYKSGQTGSSLERMRGSDSKKSSGQNIPQAALRDPEIMKALKWARQNPNDPESKELFDFLRIKQ